jgi:putative oxygen-independent coproporphyrinogen III oxidase
VKEARIEVPCGITPGGGEAAPGRAPPGEGAAGSPAPHLALPPVALYVHVPFCVSQCPYCDFVVYAGRHARGPTARIDAFLAAVDAELELRADALDRLAAAHHPLRSVYLGGGTPSLLPAAAVGRLLARIDARFAIASDAEVTLEANPGPDEIGDLPGFASAGVTRLSLGAQSMDRGELRRLGRRHAPEDVIGAIAAARRAGIASVSADLLYDVPGQTPASWADTLERVLDAGIDHVSAYALTLDDPDAERLTGPLGDHLPTTRGARAWRTRARAAQDDDRAADMYAAADARLSAAGLAWYEVSNWARPGHESRHNLVYWRHEPYEALGPGAHAFDGTVRRWNAARLDGYVAALAPAPAATAAPPPRLPPGGHEVLDPATYAAEEAILALRLASGLGPPLVERPGVAAAIAWARGHGLVEEIDGGRVRLGLRGRLLANEVFARIT